MPRKKQCFILDCRSNENTLNNWLFSQWCGEHEKWHYECPCEPPFVLYAFPKDKNKRQQWIIASNRLDQKRSITMKKKQLLRPQSYECICSKHFPGGAPDEEMMAPSLDLGYDVNSSSDVLGKLFDLSFRIIRGDPESHVGTFTIPASSVLSGRILPSTSTAVDILPGSEFDEPMLPSSTSSSPTALSSQVAVSTPTNPDSGLMPPPSTSTVPMDVLPSSESDEPGPSGSFAVSHITSSSESDENEPAPLPTSTSAARRPPKRRLDLEQVLPVMGPSKAKFRRAQKKDDDHSSEHSLGHSSDSLRSGAGQSGAVQPQPLEPLPSSSAGESGTSTPIEGSSVGDRSAEDTETTTSSSAPPLNTPKDKYSLPSTMDALKAEVQRLKVKNESWEAKYERLKGRKSRKSGVFDPLRLLKDNDKVKLYTGFPNFGTFKGFFKVLLPRARRMRFWRAHRTPVGRKKRVYKATPKRHGPPRQLPLISEFLMTLMRLRLGLLEEVLGDMFGVSPDYCSRTLISWIKFLAIEWRCLVFPPTREQVQDTLPKAFRSRPQVRYIIDGTEVFCQGTGDFRLQVLLWSNYKHHHTAKFLVAIAPNGHISFVSKAFGGHITDKEICVASGFYDILEDYDEVMADRGFPIAMELNTRHCTLRVPKGRRGIDQFAKEDIHQIKQVANTRIHVERAIKRIKTFVILQGDVTFAVLPQMSDIMLICCAICNTLPPLIREAQSESRN